MSQPNPVPAVLSPLVDLETEWCAKTWIGGANFRTHALRESSPKRLEFHATPGAIVLVVGIALVFLTVGGGAAASEEGRWFGVLFGPVALVVSAWLLLRTTSPRVFDQELGVYFRGRSPGPDDCPLARVHALQIVSKSMGRASDGHSYTSFELNLVLDDGTRTTVVCHGVHAALRADADRLSAFLDVPVWDAAEAEWKASLPAAGAENGGSDALQLAGLLLKIVTVVFNLGFFVLFGFALWLWIAPPRDVDQSGLPPWGFVLAVIGMAVVVNVVLHVMKRRLPRLG